MRTFVVTLLIAFGAVVPGAQAAPPGNDARGDALGDDGDLAADDEAAVVVAGNVALDHEIPTARLAAGAVVRARRTSSATSRRAPRG